MNTQKCHICNPPVCAETVFQALLIIFKNLKLIWIAPTAIGHQNSLDKQLLKNTYYLSFFASLKSNPIKLFSSTSCIV